MTSARSKRLPTNRKGVSINRNEVRDGLGRRSGPTHLSLSEPRGPSTYNHARYLPTGHLVYAGAGTLVAALRVTGDGLLVYVPGGADCSSDSLPKQMLTLFDCCRFFTLFQRCLLRSLGWCLLRLFGRWLLGFFRNLRFFFAIHSSSLTCPECRSCFAPCGRLDTC